MYPAGPNDRLPRTSQAGEARSQTAACPYRLIDHGNGRKLEAIGQYRIDRPCPAALAVRPSVPERWGDADARFIKAGKTAEWQFLAPWPDDAVVDCGTFQMPVRPTPFGHIGLFPEQASNWEWIDALVRRGSANRVLNLFGYTGASSMAAAAAGASVSHVDAANPNVEAARCAAQLSGLRDAPIRYLVDDVRKFVARELRRHNGYDLVVLDPPAYGHGHRGAAWRLQRDLWPLLEACVQLIPRASGAMLITGHTADVGPREIRQWMGRVRLCNLEIGSGRAGIHDSSGRFLDAGFYVRATWGEPR